MSPYEPDVESFVPRVFQDSNNNGKDDGQETQANIYEAFFSTMSTYPHILSGAFLWGHILMSDKDWGYSFGLWRGTDVRNKLAEEVVAEAYGGSLRKKNLSSINMLLLSD